MVVVVVVGEGALGWSSPRLPRLTVLSYVHVNTVIQLEFGYRANSEVTYVLRKLFPS